MKETVRENINPMYSLHDMCVIALEVAEGDVILRTQSGMIKTTPPCTQVEGYVRFRDVQWDFSYAYRLDFTGNTGPFAGEKMHLIDFVEKSQPLAYTIMDETYGYNMTRFSGYIMQDGNLRECNIEIYHEGDMIYYTDD